MNYQKIYNDLMQSRKEKCSFGNLQYWEKHHIVPKCMNGSNDKDNIVLLTPREHYIAHKLLIKIYPKNIKIYNAFSALFSMKDKRRFTIKQYENLRIIGLIVRQSRSPISEETRQKMREAAKNRPPISKETRKKLSEALMGKNKGKKLGPLPEEVKQKLKNPSEETRKKISEGVKQNRRQNPLTEEQIKWFSDFHKNRSRNGHSEETKQKMSEIKREYYKNNVISEETRKKISEAGKGRKMPPVSEETRQKMREAAKNRPPVSKETRKKMSEASKGKPKSESHKETMKKRYKKEEKKNDINNINA